MSNLPDPDEIRREIRMTIKQVIVADNPYETVRIAFDEVVGEDRVPSLVKLYKLEDADIVGYLPSKALINEWGDLVLIFYVSPSLPDRARPFAGGPVYVCVLDVDHRTPIEYDGELRCFVDQISSEHGIKYVIMFGEKQYDQIVIKDES